MGMTNHSDHKIQGDVILDRFAAIGVPPVLKKHVADFKGAHAKLVAAYGLAEKARSDRDDALAGVGEADDALDEAIDVLRDTMIGARMGDRTNPFKGFSPFAPHEITIQAYAREVKEVRALCAKVKKAKPAAGVAKQLAACEKLAGAVEGALAKLRKPQLAYAKALAARDELLPAWTKALGKLKRYAEAEWYEDRATYDSVFAPPDRIDEGKKAKRAKKTNGAPAPGTTAGTPTES